MIEYDLSPEAEGVLDLIQLTLDRELKFLKTDKWEDKPNVSDRSSRIKMHNTLLSRLLSKTVDLYVLADSNTRNKNVAEVVRKVTEAYKMFKNRVEAYLSKEDWLSYVDSDDSGKMKAEIEFQSDISIFVGNLTTHFAKLPATGEGGKFRMSTFGDKPVPLSFRLNFSEKYPEIKDILEEKLKVKKSKK